MLGAALKDFSLGKYRKIQGKTRKIRENTRNSWYVLVFSLFFLIFSYIFLAKNLLKQRQEWSPGLSHSSSQRFLRLTSVEPFNQPRHLHWEVLRSECTSDYEPRATAGQEKI